MLIAPNSVQSANPKWKVPLSFQASAQPTHTGTIAAGSVLGRAANTKDFKADAVTDRVETKARPHATPFPSCQDGPDPSPGHHRSQVNDLEQTPHLKSGFDQKRK